MIPALKSYWHNSKTKETELQEHCSRHIAILHKIDFLNKWNDDMSIINNHETHLLQMNFSALALRSKARDRPNLDFNSSVKLLIPHVPDSLNWCGNCFVLEGKKTPKHQCRDWFMLTKTSSISSSLQLAGCLYSQGFLSTVQTSILSYKDHFIDAAGQLGEI